METKYFTDCYKAQKYANKHGLKEAEYGDLYGTDIGYVIYNKQGDINEESEAEAYYDWKKNEEGRYKPVPLSDDHKNYIKHHLGIIL